MAASSSGRRDAVDDVLIPHRLPNEDRRLPQPEALYRRAQAHDLPVQIGKRSLIQRRAIALSCAASEHVCESVEAICVLHLWLPPACRNRSRRDKHLRGLLGRATALQ
jgi:hypothetical protein